MSGLDTYTVVTAQGSRQWQAEDADHAVEQHEDAFPDETVLAVSRRVDIASDES